jgi:TetR/AcrR family transcriptional regulator
MPKTSTPTPHGIRKSEARAAILAAAERIFAEAGLAGARTDTIAAQAHVNKALLYYYFKSKEHLYLAVMESNLRGFRERVIALLEAEGNVRSKIVSYVDLYFGFIAAHPYFPVLVQHLMSVGGQPFLRRVRRNAAPLYRRLAELVAEGVRRHELRRVEPYHAVYSLVAIMVFYFAAAPLIKAISREDPFQDANLQRRKQEVLGIVRHGLFLHPEAPVA